MQWSLEVLYRWLRVPTGEPDGIFTRVAKRWPEHVPNALRLFAVAGQAAMGFWVAKNAAGET